MSNPFRTVLKTPTFPVAIDYSSNILFMGSCFAENMGQILQTHGLNITINPTGILFNPSSIAQALNSFSIPKLISADDLVQQHNIWHHFNFHGKFSNPDKSVALATMNQGLNDGIEMLKQADFLIITFGTAWIYELKETNQVVANCHKFPDNLFNRRLLTIAEIESQWQQTIQTIRTVNPSIKIIFTVSPVRHLRDGHHENQISKSTLLLAIHQLQATLEHLYYFPSYEILMDDLRDYRFYNQDMVHPSQLAIDYIWQLFQDALLTPKALDYIQKVSPIVKTISHRPIHVESEETKQLKSRLLNKISELETEFPHLKWHLFRQFWLV